MRAIAIAALSTFALISAPAFAQTTPSAGGMGTSPPAAATHTGDMGSTTARPAASQSQPQPNPLTKADVSKITGTDVYGSDDKKIGSISTELMKPDSKTIDRLVISTGGVLGVGAHYVALPIDQFSWDNDKSAFKISSTEKELAGMPAWHEQSAAAPESTNSENRNSENRNSESMPSQTTPSQTPASPSAPSH